MSRIFYVDEKIETAQKNGSVNLGDVLSGEAR